MEEKSLLLSSAAGLLTCREDKFDSISATIHPHSLGGRLQTNFEGGGQMNDHMTNLLQSHGQLTVII